MIDVDATEAVRTIRFARPERRNAITPAGLDSLADAVEAADEPVVLLRGAGTAFCSGADLEAVADLDTAAAAEAFAERGQRAAARIEAAEAVTIAGIDGPARGGGLELALACDIRVATPDATLGEPGVTFGLFGAWGGTVRLPRIVGLGEAMDLCLSGRAVDAETARRMGLVSRVVDDPAAVAAAVADNEADAMQVVKQRLRDQSGRQRQEQAEAEAFADLLLEHGDELQSD